MRIVSEKSEADVAHHHALERVERRLRELAANLLRIIRGAGKPYEMILQMVELVEAIQAYQAVVGRAPWEEFNRALDVSRDIKDMQHWNAEDRHRDDAEHQIIQGVLQVVASRLVRQLNQETIGQGEMSAGLRAFESYRAKARKVRLKGQRERRRQE
jgi:hypothetical protein